MSAGPEEIAHAVARLRSGGLVAFPTETVYGLGADALRPDAVARVFALKGRPSINPLIVHVSGEAMARGLSSAWPSEATTLARAFWPGPLTLVVPAAAHIPAAVTAGGSTVGLRCPAHHITLSLLEAFGGPLVGPSANPSGRVSPTTAEHVRAAFSEDEMLVLDGGPCRGGIESTVVSLAGPTPRMLRPGLIGAEELGRVLGRAVEAQGPPGPGPLDSPGQLAVHYAPSSPAVVAAAEDVARAIESSPGPVVLLAYSSAEIRPGVHLIPMPTEAAAYAARLYAAFREADALSPALIVIERPPGSGPIWEAVADRLSRAAAAFGA